jgi:hypothetical protein
MHDRGEFALIKYISVLISNVCRCFITQILCNTASFSELLPEAHNGAKMQYDAYHFQMHIIADH